ncbi:MAG: ATP-binding protein [Victivallales bacterium]|nr:ATP-binding protein [Victivallales bacterium]
MITKEELGAVVARQRQYEKQRDIGQKRMLAFNEALLSSHALDITGVRRCGKSTFLTQRMRDLGEDWFFLNFESPQLTSLELRDAGRLDSLIEEAGTRNLFFDEVDQFKGWEHYVRQKLDEGYRICLTGSNASLLEGELGTKLTGRHISRELYPFDYQEYLTFTKQLPGLESTQAYMRQGGFPRFLQVMDESIFWELYDDIVYRDVIVHNGIREVESLKKLVAYLIENIGCRFTASKMLESLSVSCASTVSQWCDWLEKAFMFFFIPVFSDSVKKQLLNPRKVYCIDTGLEYAISSRRIPNDGMRFENMVFLALRRHFRNIYYYNGKGECDFVVSDRHAVSMLVQACVSVTQDDMEREFNGLREAMKEFGLTEGFIVTEDQTDVFDVAEGRIHLLPFSKFTTLL